MSYEIRCSPRLRGRATSSPSLTLPSGARAGKLAVSLFSRGEIVALRSLPSWQLPVLALGIRVTQTVAMALRDFLMNAGLVFIVHLAGIDTSQLQSRFSVAVAGKPVSCLPSVIRSVKNAQLKTQLKGERETWKNGAS